MKKRNSLRPKKKLNQVWSWLLLLLSILWLIPIFFIVLNSFKSMGEVLMNPIKLPTTFNLKNYKDVWNQISYLKLFSNSVIVLVISESLIILFCSMTGFWLQRTSNHKGTRILISYFLLSLFIPFQAIMISLIAVFSVFGLTKDFTGLIISNIGLSASMALFLFYGYSQQIPKEINEAASVDGASPTQTFFGIIFPLMNPIVATVLILTSLTTWNDYLKPLLLIQNNKYLTLPVGTARVVNGQYFTRYNLAVTALVMAAIPVLIAFMFLQKKIVSGVVSGAVKG
jgi:raffinose/stachyose/melibiose transport system permease protein